MLNFLFKPKLDSVDLAYELFATLGVGSTGLPPQYEQAANKILEKITDRQETLLKVIELAGNPDTPKRRYIIAKAYSWSRAPYRKKAIEYLELYLNNGLYEKRFRSNSHFLWIERESTPEENRDTHMAEILQDLGQAYEGKYLFDKALECFPKESVLLPYFAYPETPEKHV